MHETRVIFGKLRNIALFIVLHLAVPSQMCSSSRSTQPNGSNILSLFLFQLKVIPL